MQDLTLVHEIAKLLDAKKALSIAAYDIRHLTVISDYMVIASGRSVTQVNALVDHVQEKMEELNQPLIRADGPNNGRWSILDYGGVLVQIFHVEEREYYNLDRLWDDGTNRILLSFQSQDESEHVQRGALLRGDE